MVLLYKSNGLTALRPLNKDRKKQIQFCYAITLQTKQLVYLTHGHT